jgi:hypothetical protein
MFLLRKAAPPLRAAELSSIEQPNTPLEGDSRQLAKSAICKILGASLRQAHPLTGGRPGQKMLLLAVITGWPVRMEPAWKRPAQAAFFDGYHDGFFIQPIKNHRRHSTLSGHRFRQTWCEVSLPAPTF